MTSGEGQAAGALPSVPCGFAPAQAAVIGNSLPLLSAQNSQLTLRYRSSFRYKRAHGLRVRLGAILRWWTGRNGVECVEVRWYDVETPKGRIWVGEGKKNRSDRFVPGSSNLIQVPYWI